MKINNTIISISLLVVSLLIVSTQQANAQTHCYRFDNPPVDTVYEPGETINTQHADINVMQFITGINVGNARISDSNVIDNAQPSLLIAAATIQVVPDDRVQSVTIDYAENAPADNPQGWNLGANGKLLEWRGTLSEQDGETMGKRNNGGRVSVAVTSVPSPDSNWIEGTLTLTSNPVNPTIANRGISRFAFGRTSQLLVDNVCMTY